jgi:hypothetical protein
MDHDLRSPDPRFWRGFVLGLLICTPLWVVLGMGVAEAVH